MSASQQALQCITPLNNHPSLPYLNGSPPARLQVSGNRLKQDDSAQFTFCEETVFSSLGCVLICTHTSIPDQCSYTYMQITYIHRYKGTHTSTYAQCWDFKREKEKLECNLENKWCQGWRKKKKSSGWILLFHWVLALPFSTHFLSACSTSGPGQDIGPCF